jgi:aspartyl-tRNA synthetase
MDKVKGWIYRIRDLGKIKFILLRDGKNIYQLIVKKGESSDDLLKLELRPEYVIEAEGIWKEGKGGKKELLVKNLRILAKAEPLPIDPEKATPKTRFDWRVIDLKLPQRQTLFWLRTKVLKHFRDFFLKEGFVEINTPKIVNIGAESGAEVFPVMYFGKEAYLAQSPQLYKQMLVSVFPKVFDRSV